MRRGSSALAPASPAQPSFALREVRRRLSHQFILVRAICAAASTNPSSHISDAKIQILLSLIKIKETSLGAQRRGCAHLFVRGWPRVSPSHLRPSLMFFCLFHWSLGESTDERDPFILPEAHNSVRLWALCAQLSRSSAYAPLCWREHPFRATLPVASVFSLTLFSLLDIALEPVTKNSLVLRHTSP